MSAEQDINDGLPEYHRAPPDVVPRRTLPAEDIPVGMAEVVHYEMTADGIERVTEHIHVTAPYTGKDTTP
ncbi:hypothetical protein [Nocardia asiatica]|uniref:hypothetical protein n=1 Tax=Nocardia asiatica TaxID=209252 RepID=UPI002454B353|nr:hypothetical protein [Nocardia asiatica]